MLSYKHFPAHEEIAIYFLQKLTLIASRSPSAMTPGFAAGCTLATTGEAKQTV